MRARSIGKLAHQQQLRDLPAIGRVAGGARPQPVTNRNSHVMLAQHGADLVEMLVERILVARPLDPRRQHRTAARHDALDSLMPAQTLHALARDAAM